MLAANHMTVLKPNILYLEEKPSNTVKTRKLKTNRKSNKKTAGKSKTKQKIPLSKIKQDYIIKEELCIYDEQHKQIEYNVPAEPLYTAKLEIKCELDDEKANEQEEFNNYDDHDYNYEHDVFEIKREKSQDEYDEYNDNGNEEKDRLIVLSRRKSRSGKIGKEKSQEPKQISDPQTVNDQEKQENKKRIRRKPGDPVPEHFPKPIKCAVRCIHKCHTKFSEEERKEICDFFWSMDFKRRKDFVLSTMEIKDVETQKTPDLRTSNRPHRTHKRRFFLRSGGMHGENLRICRDFYIKTLCITGGFIDNAVQFADKTTGCYTGSDRRGGFVPNKKNEERKQVILNHINSYPFWIPNENTTTKYLHHSLTIKKMYNAYKEKCLADKISYVSTFCYYTAFHDNFNLLFLSNSKKGSALQKVNPNISDYTGEEPGGCWIDSKGNKLDLRSINPAKSLNIF